MYKFIELDVYKTNTPKQQLEKVEEEFEEVQEALICGFDKKLVIDEIIDVMQSCHGLLRTLGLDDADILNAIEKNNKKVGAKYGWTT